jgi:hypothetical protein
VQVLGNGGGGLKALGRHTVAALLNGADPDVDYKYTDEEVIAMFQAVYPGKNKDYEALKDKFAVENERGTCDPRSPKATPTGTAASAVSGPRSLPNSGGPLGSAGSGAAILLLLAALIAIGGGAAWASRTRR